MIYNLNQLDVVLVKAGSEVKGCMPQELDTEEAH